MAKRAKPVVFEMFVDRIQIDEDCATLDLVHPKVPGGKRDHNIPDEHLKEQRAWFAGLNDEFGSDSELRIAIYGSDGCGFRAGGLIRITVEPIDG